MRVFVEHIDVATLQRIVPPPKGEKWGSLKSLENVLASVIGDTPAHRLLGPLHGVYNLRLADAHVRPSELDEAYALVRLDRTKPYIMQGRDLLAICVDVLHIGEELLNRGN